MIGGGGEFLDSCAEVRRMLEMDPTPAGKGEHTLMFRKPDGTAFTTDDIRAIVRQVAVAIGERILFTSAHTV